MFKSLTDCFDLNNGEKIPCVGFGTFQTPEGETCSNSVEAALKAGYRHIDTAKAYGNEKSVGIGIRKSGIPRKEIFVTSKLPNTEHGYDLTVKSFDETMKNLDMDYLDLYLIHWPNPLAFRDNWKEANAGSWKAMEELHKKGRIRTLGLSNFWPHHLEALLKTATVLPAVNQIRLHPGEIQAPVVEYCRAHNIVVEAYSPLGTGSIFSIPDFGPIAKKYNKTIPQICLRWSLQMGFLPLPKSAMAERIIDNTRLFDFEISREDMDKITLIKGVGEALHPDKQPW